MKSILYILLIVIISSSYSHGQVIQIGAGTAVNTITTASPINTATRRQVSQFVYTVAEINEAGLSGANVLTQLGFFVTNNPFFALPGYTIKIKHTNQTNVSNSLGTTGFTTVKNAFNYDPTPGGYDMIEFDTPFNWNGFQNIGVEICWSQIQPRADNSGQCRIYNSFRGYRYRRDNNGGSICGATTNIRSNNKPQVQLIFRETATWTGAVSSDWFNRANWNIGSVPDEQLNVLIPNGVPNMPEIADNNASCKNLTISTGASLTMSGANNIDIHANWTNNGTFIPNNGNITLKGDGANNINGAVNQNLNDLTIDNVNGATIASGSINLSGTLDIGVATGNFNTNNALTITSDATGTGRIGELTTKCIYTLEMFDTYGDSWNGAFITILVDGLPIGNYAAQRDNSTSRFIANVGATVQLNYTPGIYEFENSYRLVNSNGTTLFSDGLTPATGTNVFSVVTNCAFFNPISGNINMQRYVDAGATNWRFLTSATSGTSLADFNDDFITSGFTGSDFPIWPSPSNIFTSIYFYDEPALGAQLNGFRAASNVSESLAVGEGLWIWSGDTITGTQPFTIDITGPPNVGDINLPITYTNSGSTSEDGWNMVGNPYPSSINWDSPNINKTGINNAIYIWNPDLQQFASYVGGLGTNGGSQNLASSQAFWVQATSPGASITVSEACKTTTEGAFLKQAINASPFKLKVQNNSGQDEIIINFNNNASNSFDPSYDAKKIGDLNSTLPINTLASNNIPVISSSLNGVDYAINQIPSQEINIPIKILVKATGFYTVSAENITGLSNSSCLILEDLFSGTNYNLSTTSSFNVFIQDTTSIPQFLLHIGAPKSTSVIPLSCSGTTDASITLSKNSASPFNVLWKDSAGNVIANSNNVMISDSVSNLSAGTYYIESTDLTCGNTIDTVQIDNPLPIASLFSISNDTIHLSNGGNVSFTNQSSNAINYLWDFGDGDFSNSPSPTHNYNQNGNYTVTLTASRNSLCFENYTLDITVLDEITSVDNDLVNEKTIKTWVNDNTLNINLGDKSYNQLEVRNLLGQLIYLNDNLTATRYTIDISEFKSSLYLIALSDSKNTAITKVPYIK